MSTLVQIESAVAGLPMQDQWTLLTWLQGRLANSPKGEVEAAMPEALQAFRQLQTEVSLTTEGATAWKKTIEDARR